MIPSALQAYHVTPYIAWRFEETTARQTLLDHFGASSLAGFGCEDKPLAVRAAGGLLQYLQEAQKDGLAQITGLRTYSTAEFMTLDEATRRNLELTESIRGGTVQGSLLGVLDATLTPMGGREIAPPVEPAAARRNGAQPAPRRADRLARRRARPHRAAPDPPRPRRPRTLDQPLRPGHRPSARPGGDSGGVGAGGEDQGSGVRGQGSGTGVRAGQESRKSRNHESRSRITPRSLRRHRLPPRHRHHRRAAGDTGELRDHPARLLGRARRHPPGDA